MSRESLAELKGYITARIDAYDGIKGIIKCVPTEEVIFNLSRLIEIIEDMQGMESANVEVALRRHITELEESCENMCEVERNLNRKIRLLERTLLLRRQEA